MSDRERDFLASALSRIQGSLCPFCETRRAVIRWTGTRWQVRVTCRPRCRSTRTPRNRREAREFVFALLEFYGSYAAHFNEDDLVKHVRLAVL